MSHTAIVILNYNGEKLLHEFLPSVIEHSSAAQIIVADNGSTDKSLMVLERDFPSVQVIALDKNYGFCGGYNRALKQVKATYYVLLNSDVQVTANWLTPLVALLDHNETIAAVQPKILSYHAPTMFEYAGAGGGFIDTLGYPFCRGRILSTVEADLNQYNDTRPIFWASGACLLIRAEVYHLFTGLDEDFFAHMEEIDLCWKIHRAKMQVYYCGSSTVFHLGAGTLGYGSARKSYLNFRNGLVLIYKHFNTTELLYKLPLRITLDWFAALMFLMKGEVKNFQAVWRAHFYFLKNLQSSQQKRKHIHQMYPTYSKTTMYKRSIIFDYYLRGKRKFSELL